VRPDGGEGVREVLDTMIPVSSTEAAELVKLLENTFRAINIALVNEMAQVADRLDVDIWEVINAAATKPFGFMKFTPGPASAATASRWIPTTCRGR
jgi:UDP-N-acetyl-D-glucosamine dehydrogenase